MPNVASAAERRAVGIAALVATALLVGTAISTPQWAVLAFMAVTVWIVFLVWAIKRT
jgi:acyl CoA:acetate/3-ketoacid CoA transferase alpha subunit